MDLIKKVIKTIGILVIASFTALLVFILGLYLGYKEGQAKIPPYTPRDFDDYSASTRLYLKITSSPDILSEKEKEKFINIVKNYSVKNIVRNYKVEGDPPTYEYELSHSFPSIPLDFRRWECYRYNGNIYVFYELRIASFIPTASFFVWKVREEDNEVIPINACAFLAYQAITTPLGKYKYPAYRALTPKEREIFDFLEDRYIENKDPEKFEKNVEKAALKFNISKEEVKKIVKKFYEALRKSNKT